MMGDGKLATNLGNEPNNIPEAFIATPSFFDLKTDKDIDLIARVQIKLIINELNINFFIEILDFFDKLVRRKLYM